MSGLISMFSRLRRRLGPELPAAPTPPAAAEPARPIVHAWEPAPEAPIAAHDEAAPPPAWHPAPEAPADHAPPDAEPPEAVLTQVEPAPEPAPDLAAVEGTAGIEASSTAEPATIPAPDAILASARAAADTGDTAAAASVLQAGLVLHPAELALHIAYARLAEAHGDWPEAASRWRSLEAAVPDAPDGWLGHAIALQRLGFAAEAEAALQDLIRRFPDQLDALHDLARLAEFRGDWATAERCWLDFHAIETGNWWSHSALASAVMRQGRPDEAEAILQQALTRFPDEPSLLADHARVAESREDWDEAISRWEDVIARAPSHWAGYGGKVAALARLGRQDEADAALLDYGALLPDHPAALHDLGRRAERLQDWPAAEAAWRGFVAQEQRNDWAYQSLAQALVRQDRLDEAEAVLTDAMARLPGSAALAIEAARVSELRGQLDAAAAHWRTASRLAPATADGPIGEASVLSRQGDAAAADAVIEAALARLPAEPALLHAYANTAIAAADWPQALARLQTGQQRFPEVASFGHRIEAIEARLAAEADTPDPTADEAAAEDIRALLLDFESLGGGGGQGGAFARFQRDHGAEPIGLLHWAEALPDELSDALESDFSGIGIPEQTDFSVPPEIPRQYRITDRRTGLSLPTFIDAETVPLDEARSLVDQRLGVLRSKLLDDLRQGSRILVYLHGRRSLTAPELDRLHAACRRWGDNTLFYIRHADTLHPVGSVAWAAPGLLVGSLDPADPEVPDTLPAATLLPLCQRAHALWRERAAALPAAPPRSQRRRDMADLMGPAAPPVPTLSAQAPPAQTSNTARDRLLRAAAALRDSGRLEDAEAVLAAAGAAASPAADPAAAIAAVHAARDAGRLDEAAALLAAARAAWPDDDELVIESGWLAHIRRDWPQAADWWQTVRTRTPWHLVGYVNGAIAARETDDIDAAEDLLVQAAARFPDQPDIAIEHAALAQHAGDWNAATSRWQDVRARFPDQPAAYTGAARALREQSQFARRGAAARSRRPLPGVRNHRRRIWLARPYRA